MHVPQGVCGTFLSAVHVMKPSQHRFHFLSMGYIFPLNVSFQRAHSCFSHVIQTPPHSTSCQSALVKKASLAQGVWAQIWAARDIGMPTFNATPGAWEGSDLSEVCLVSQQLGPAALRVLGIGPRPGAVRPQPLTCAVLLRAETSLPGKEGQRPWGAPEPGDASLC